MSEIVNDGSPLPPPISSTFWPIPIRASLTRPDVNGAVGFPHARCHPSEDFDRLGTIRCVFLDRIRGDGAFDQSQRSGLITEAHVGQRENSDETRIFRLFFEEGLQVAACLAPTSLGGGVVAVNFLRPA